MRLAQGGGDEGNGSTRKDDYGAAAAGGLQADCLVGGDGDLHFGHPGHVLPLPTHGEDCAATQVECGS